MAPPTWPDVQVGDGAVGDTSHQARPSDHNPDWDSGGVVRAVDIGVQGRDERAILNATIGDPRVWYVIFNRKIYSRTYGWRANTYTGSNPHTHHIHVSLVHSKRAEESEARWFGDKRRTTLPRVDLSNVRREFRQGGPNAIRGVRLVQRALNAKLGIDLQVDGHAGSATKRAYAAWEDKINAPKGDGIPGGPSLRELGRRRFRVVE
jgi:hypothetical protein